MVGLFDKRIIFYSKYCDHCKKFLDILARYNVIRESCLIVCIDVDNNTRKRHPIFYQVQNALQRNITKVPTMIEHKSDSVSILSGIEAFKWLQFTVKQLIKKNNEKDGKITPFSPMEMELITDIYTNCGESKLSDLFEKNMQSFIYINKPLKRIITPRETNTTITSNDYENVIKQREKTLDDIPKQNGKIIQSECVDRGLNEVDIDNYRQQIEIQNNGLTFKPVSVNNRRENMRKIEQEMERYAAIRDRDTPNIPKVDSSKIDFQTGEIIY